MRWDQPEDEEDDLNATDDGKSAEKSHGASNQTQLPFETDLLVSLNLVVGGRVKEDVDKLKGWIRQVLTLQKKDSLKKQDKNTHWRKMNLRSHWIGLCWHSSSYSSSTPLWFCCTGSFQPLQICWHQHTTPHSGPGIQKFPRNSVQCTLCPLENKVAPPINIWIQYFHYILKTWIYPNSQGTHWHFSNNDLLLHSS